MAAESRWRLVMAAVVLVHVALVAYFLPLPLAFGSRPFAGNDLDIHIHDTATVVEALQHGRSVAYEPRHNAGFPVGTIFDADSKAWELFIFTLGAVGVPFGTAFNLYILVLALGVPFAVAYAARRFGLEPPAAVLAAALAVAGWFFDGSLHWCWWEGMISFAAVSYLALVPLAHGYRFFADGSTRDAFALAGWLALLHLVHAYAVLVLAVPLLYLYASAWPRFSWRQHLGVAGVVGFTLLLNGYWIHNALLALGTIVPVPDVLLGASTLSTLWSDLLGVHVDERITGPVHAVTGWRFAIIAAGFAALVAGALAGPRRRFFGATLGLLFLVAYLGGYVGAVRQIQPYRLIFPCLFLATLPAAVGLLACGRWVGQRRAWGVRAGIGLVGALVAAKLVLDVLYFFPVPVLGHAAPSMEGTRLASEQTSFDRQRRLMRGFTTLPTFDPAARWLARNVGAEERVLVQSWKLGERLLSTTRLHVLGGFEFRSLEHNAAHLFARYLDGVVPERVLAAHLETYAVSYLVISRHHGHYLAMGDTLRPVRRLGPHLVLRVLKPATVVAAGRGRVTTALDRIRVAGSRPDEDLVLRFHHDPAFSCRPSCRLAREPIPGDAVGFVRVLAPHPADLTIAFGK